MGNPVWIVTGGAGFIGCNFVRLALARSDAKIVVIDKLTYAGHTASLEEVASHPRYAFERVDIADAAAVAEVIHAHRPSAILNFAAETHVDRSIDGPAAFIQTNIVGTFELLEATRNHLARLDRKEREHFRFLHISTDEVYGSLGPRGAFVETTPYRPNSPYSASKAAADHLVHAYGTTFDLPVLITNCSNNYGPFQYPEKLLPVMILRAAEGRKLPVYGDGGNIRDWLYVEDHCSGILEVLRHGRLGEKYNIGGNTERTNLQVVNALCEVLERVLPAAHNPQLAGVASYADLVEFVTDRPGHDRRYAIDASKIRSELGWRPAYEFDRGLAATVEWYLSHREWCSAVHPADELQRIGLGGR